MVGWMDYERTISFVVGWVVDSKNLPLLKPLCSVLIEKENWEKKRKEESLVLTLARGIEKRDAPHHRVHRMAAVNPKPFCQKALDAETARGYPARVKVCSSPTVPAVTVVETHVSRYRTRIRESKTSKYSTLNQSETK